MVPNESLILALVAGWAAALAIGGATLWLAPRIQAVALPNERSSHERPTPTLGGLSFVVPMLIWLALSPMDWGWQLGLAAGALALLGLVDDLIDVPSIVRLVLQFVCIGGIKPENAQQHHRRC